MLEAIRSGVGSWIVKLFLGLLIASFAVWGIGDTFRTTINDSVASVGNAEIPGSVFAAEFNRQLRVMQSRFGADLDTQAALRLGLADNVLNRMVARLAFDLDARRNGLRISDRKVKQDIQSNDSFKNDFGDFDRFRFNQLLQAIGMTEAQFIENTRADIAREQLMNGLTVGARASLELARLLYRYRFEIRAADYFTIPASSITGLPAPDDETLARFHKEHAQDFMAPEYRKLSFVMVGAADLAPEIEISEDDLRAEYEARKYEFGREEHRTVDQIVFTSSEQAKTARAGLIKGEDFAAAAAAAGAGKDVSLGEVTRKELVGIVGEEAAAAIFALKEGTISEPVETAFGWHLFRVTKITPATIPPFEKVRDKVRLNLAKEHATDALYKLANQLDDELASGATLEEVAQRAGLVVHTVAAVDASGRDPAGLEVPGLPKTAEFLDAAFKNDVGDDLYLEETKDGSYFLVRVDEITPAALRPLAEIRDKVVARWTTGQRDKAARTRTEEAVRGLKLGGDFAALAERFGTKSGHIKALKRDGSGAPSVMSRDVINKLFSVDSSVDSGVTFGPRAGHDGYVVAKLTKVVPGDPDNDPNGLAALRRSLRQGIGDNILEEYQARLFDEFGTKVNRKLMMALFQNTGGGTLPTTPIRSY